MKMLSQFGENIDKSNPLNEYPRPQLKRESYLCLNGEWEYAILPKENQLRDYQGKIIVPFSTESLPSGVDKLVSQNDILYYKRNFVLEKKFIKDRVIINFGAVDYFCEVKINGKKIGENKGGYFPFSFDITDLIVVGENVIEVKVVDPSEFGVQARGKQTTKRVGIWYTLQSGIWQTVWIESVSNAYIKSLKITPNIDNNTISIKADYNKKIENARIKIFDKGEIKVEAELDNNGRTIIRMDDYELWSPENPYLYDIQIEANEDKVCSYFGMRKYSIGTDDKGIQRLMLNNKPYFHNGLLDQGYWSDGMYTAPSDEAMIYDIKTMKEMGFNMLRKHIKIEPLRWYYHCDKIGMIVWQDMINGGNKYNILAAGFLGLLGIRKNDNRYKFFGRESKDGREEYYRDSLRMIETLYNVASIAVWVPFNEGWGQFDSKKAYDFYKKADPTRIVDHASGWIDQNGGDLKSCHIYFRKVKIKKDKRPVVLSEYGGYSLPVENHLFNEKKVFGYKKFKNKEDFGKAYKKLMENEILPLIPEGLSATVYTEVSDVEDECNGLFTYDRKVLKLDKDFVKEINDRIKL